MIVTIDADKIVDWDSFHDQFAQAFGFFDGYGRNMNAWIDCMGSLSSPESGLTGFTVPDGVVVTLRLANVRAFKERLPDLYDGLVECAAFVNWSLIEGGYPSVLALAFYS